MTDAFPLSHGQKRPRVKQPKYLTFIRSLPCVITLTPAEAAHVRYGDINYGKPHTGIGQKPDDYWAIPLCPEFHRLGKDNQHSMGERGFWSSHKIDPLAVCALLHLHFTHGDPIAAALVCQNARKIGKGPS